MSGILLLILALGLILFVGTILGIAMHGVQGKDRRRSSAGSSGSDAGWWATTHSGHDHGGWSDGGFAGGDGGGCDGGGGDCG